MDFNPRSPRGERRGTQMLSNCGHDISIHAPLAGSDETGAASGRPVLNFNPRSPRGERPLIPKTCSRQHKFQSTLPSRGATPPSMGSQSYKRFQSTLPSRGATVHKCYQIVDMIFQSTLPSRGATRQERPVAALS